MSEPALPTEEEIAQLPRWARVAFAARCARRVLPLFRSSWRNAPTEHVLAVARAVEVAEQSAATTRAASFGAFDDADAAIRAFDDANAAIRTAIRAAHAVNAAYAASIAQAVAHAAATVATYDVTQVAAHAFATAHIATNRAPSSRPAVRADFDRLKQAVLRERWTDEIPVPPDFFGVLWPEGPPPDWPVEREQPQPAEEPPAIVAEPQSVLPATHEESLSSQRRIQESLALGFHPGEPVPHREMWMLEENLGKGGFGEVWLARHQDTNEVRAVKFCFHPTARDLLTHIATHESKVARHVRKHMSEPGGCHPNIVPLLDCNLTGNTPWLMYEFVPGKRTLADVIDELASLPPAERLNRALPLLHTIAKAVGQLHRIPVSIVHRDLKPKNVLMDGDTPRITDFGIGGAAVVAAISDATGGLTELTVDVPTMFQTAGSPPHASYEQLTGQPPHPCDDVYALGVMAYQMLVGKATAEVKGNWQRRLRTDSVPEPLIELIGDSTSEREHRPTDAAIWADKLAALLPDRSAIAAGAVVKRTVTVVGQWYSRPLADPEADWLEGEFTPGDMTFQPERVYRLDVHEVVFDRHLEGFRVLHGIVPFGFLNLSDCSNLTDAGLEHLKSLTSLQNLNLSNCNLTDAGLEHLKSLTSLQNLDLRGCGNLTGAGLEHLKTLTSLQTLHLSWCRELTDVGLEHLKPLTSLQNLDLSGCDNLTDVGLEHLKTFTSLQTLDLSYCRRLTHEGITALKKALLGCEIRLS